MSNIFILLYISLFAYPLHLIAFPCLFQFIPFSPDVYHLYPSFYLLLSLCPNFLLSISYFPSLQYISSSALLFILLSLSLFRYFIFYHLFSFFLFLFLSFLFCFYVDSHLHSLFFEPNYFWWGFDKNQTSKKWIVSAPEICPDPTIETIILLIKTNYSYGAVTRRDMAYVFKEILCSRRSSQHI